VVFDKGLFDKSSVAASEARAECLLANPEFLGDLLERRFTWRVEIPPFKRELQRVTLRIREIPFGIQGPNRMEFRQGYRDTVLVTVVFELRDGVSAFPPELECPPFSRPNRRQQDDFWRDQRIKYAIELGHPLASHEIFTIDMIDLPNIAHPRVVGELLNDIVTRCPVFLGARNSE